MYHDRKSYEEYRDVWLWVAGKMANLFRRRQKKQLARIDHVAIQVDDIASAIAWYRNHWDCEIQWSDDTWALLKFDNLSLALVLPEQHPGHVAFLTNDPSKFGRTVDHRDGTSSCYIKDPWGNDIEMLKRPKWTVIMF